MDGIRVVHDIEKVFSEQPLSFGETDGRRIKSNHCIFIIFEVFNTQTFLLYDIRKHHETFGSVIFKHLNHK